MKQSKYKISDDLYKCECGKEFNNSQSLNAHFSHCKIHRQTIGKDISDNYFNVRHHKGEMLGWDKFTEHEKQHIYDKAGKTLSENIKNGITTPSFKGKHQTKNAKDKIRLFQAKQHKIIDSGPVYNKKSISFINDLNIKNKWNLQHAENGGEICCAGYYLDGYDKELNIVFEYDEQKHYIDWRNNILKEYDIHRMNRIKELLHCEFYRYNERLNLFYKI